MEAWVQSDLTKVLISKAVCGEVDWDEGNFFLNLSRGNVYLSNTEDLITNSPCFTFRCKLHNRVWCHINVTHDTLELVLLFLFSKPVGQMNF